MTKKTETPTYGPASMPYTISSGRPCRLVQPPLFDLASGKIDMPNSAKSDVWTLLLRYSTGDDPAQQLLADEKWTRSHFYAAQLALEPRLKLDEDDEKGVIDQRELSIPDLLAIYDFCRFGLPAKPSTDRQPGNGADAGQSGDGLPSATE